MTTKLTVIARVEAEPGAMYDDLFDEIAMTVGKDLRRCDTPEALPDCLADFRCHNDGRCIDVLDIVGHGRRGRIHLGKDVLFCCGNRPDTAIEGAKIASALCDHLAPTAHVRLLGCSTAHERLASPHQEGRWLLVELAKILGESRTVFGTLAAIDAHCFSVGGLKPSVAVERLFSSREAEQGDAPSYHQRLVALEESGCRVNGAP